MFTTPALFLTPTLLVWLVLGLQRRPTPPLKAYLRRTLFWTLLATALAVSALWASPFGPSRTVKMAAWNLVALYPVWLILSVIWLLPGIVLSRILGWTPLLVLPSAAITIGLALGAISNWPPTRWWPLIIAGQMPTPSGYISRHSN